MFVVGNFALPFCLPFGLDMQGTNISLARQLFRAELWPVERSEPWVLSHIAAIFLRPYLGMLLSFHLILPHPLLVSNL